MVELVPRSKIIFITDFIKKILNFQFSSADEFDRPLRNYIEKAMSQPSQNKKSSSTSAASNAFANEMEDELDQIYNNFISRGTFELPISSELFI